MYLVISLVNLVGLHQMSAVVQVCLSVYVFSKIAISTVQNSEVKTILNVQFHAYTHMYMQSSISLISDYWWQLFI